MIPIRDTSVSKGFAPVTACIILINIIMFVEELQTGGDVLQLFGASPLDIYGYLTEGLGSIITIHFNIMMSAFMHAGYIHLIGNMIFLSVFGPAVEKRIGPIRFIIFYLIALMASFYTHFLVYPHSPTPVVGASGAIAAIMGAYLVFSPKAKILTIIPLLFFIEVVEIPSFLFILAWFTLQGFNGYLSTNSLSTIAWFSHIGGFITGLASGIYLRWFK